VVEVGFHRPFGDEEALGDLPIRVTFGGQVGDTALLRGQRVDAASRRPPGPAPGDAQSVPGLRGETLGTAPMGEVQGLPERFLGRRPLAVLAQCAAAGGAPATDAGPADQGGPRRRRRFGDLAGRPRRISWPAYQRIIGSGRVRWVTA
jgi:hypothetical protein